MRALLLSLLLCGCASSGVKLAPEQPAVSIAPKPAGIHYPRRMFRVTAHGDGSPMIGRHGELVESVLDTLSKYDILTIYAPPLVARPDIVEALRKRNPNQIILATLPGGVWANEHPMLGDTTTDLAWARWRAVHDNGAFLYGTAGGWLAQDDNVDRANHRAAISLAAVDSRAALGVDGLWLDTICLGEGWRESALDSIDWRRSGYECRADWERDYAIGHRIYVEALRHLRPDATLVGNCGPQEQDVLNGTMRENFPAQWGGSFNTNMTGFAGHPGYLTENYQRPHLSILTGWVTGDSARDARKFMFGLASATLGDGAWEMDAPGMNVAVPPYWPPAYNVDLGIPLGKAYQLADFTWRRDFSRGFVTADQFSETGRIVAR